MIAQQAYLRALEDEDVLDFTETLARAVRLLEQMDEFSRSRFRLESRYHHVLVDEFQDTSRLQWRLVSLLVEAWRAGEGTSADAPLPPTVFVVGDRKQSIYRFRDAEVAILDEASRHIAALRPGTRPHRAITTSFRSAPALLAFVNDLFDAIEKSPGRSDGFRYDDSDRFPVLDPGWAERLGDDLPLGVAVGTSPGDTASRVAGEIVKLVASGVTVRDRESGRRRPIQPGDVAILFRSRESHREHEAALADRAVPTYVYRGLGFFGSDEIQDLSALTRFLAQPDAPAREAAFLRSRFVRLSDAGLVELAGDLGRVLASAEALPSFDRLGADDREVLDRTRAAARGWLASADRVPPADLVDAVVRDTAYAYEMRGARYPQARENAKKFRALLRRIQNRGYATLGRIADHLDRLSAGDESNAAVDAVNAVNLMTVHAAKGLEFPVIFVVNLTRGTGTTGPPCASWQTMGEGSPRCRLGRCASKPTKRRSGATARRRSGCCTSRSRAPATACTLRRPWRPTASWSPGTAAWPRCCRGAWPTCSPPAPRAEPRPSGRPGPAFTGSSGVARARRPPGCCRRRLPAPPSICCGPWPPHRSWRRPLSARRSRWKDRRPRAWSGTRAASATPWRVAWCTGCSRRSTRRAARGGGRWTWLTRRRSAPSRARWSRMKSGRPCGTSTPSSRRRALPGVTCTGGRTCRALFDGVRASYEVPFSLRLPEVPGEPVRVVRGAIDCLLVRPDGDVTVVEIKTGRPLPWHRNQLALYVRAAEALAPGARVRGVLLSPAGQEIVSAG